MPALTRNTKLFLAFFLIILLIIGLALALTLPSSSNNSTTTSGDTSSESAGLVGKFIYQNGPGVSGDYEDDIKAALEEWDKIILDDKKIDIDFYSYTSNDDTLAFAFMNDENNIYAGGVVYINTYNKARTSMKNIIEHEIGHVLGIGTSKKWEMANNTSVLDKNLFPNAYQFYSNWVDGTPHSDGIPLGARGYHWSEDVFDIELMTPFSEDKGVELPTSGLTLNALKDIGWNVDLSRADSFSPTV